MSSRLLNHEVKTTRSKAFMTTEEKKTEPQDPRTVIGMIKYRICRQSSAFWALVCKVEGVIQDITSCS